VEADVKFYNEERPHMSIDMMTPKKADQCTGEIPKRWTSFRENHIKEKQTACVIPGIYLPLLPVCG
jgi:putative transposase